MKKNQSTLAFVVLTFAILACQAAAPVAQPAPTMPVVENVPPLEPVTNPASEGDALVTLFDRASLGTVAILTDQGQGSGFVYDS